MIFINDIMLENFNIFKICGFALLVIVIIVIIKQVKSEFVLTTKLAASIIFLTVTISLIIPIFSYIKEITQGTAVAEYSEILLKATGIAFLIKITSDICRDMGESTVAGYVESIGKLELIILAIPLIEKIMSIIKELL